MRNSFDQPKIKLPEDLVYSLLKEKRNAGVLNTTFDFVDLETTTGEVLGNRVVEDAEYLVLYHHETLTHHDIKDVKLYRLELAKC